MSKRVLPAEYVYRDEVFPVLIIGIAVNLAGGYLIDAAKAVHAGPANPYFSVAMLWQDTGGTAFVALALGPWWAAMAGIISSTLNTFLAKNFGDAFAYATVNIGLGLTWGYVARAVSSDAVLIAPKVTELGWRAVRAGLALVVSGAIAATAVTDLVKISLLERAGGSLLQGQPLGTIAETFLERLGLRDQAHYLALFFIDFYVNIFDKGLSLVVALILVNAIGVVPSSQTRGTRLGPLTLTERLRVSGDSIICFAAVYTGYLLMGRLILTSVHFEGSPINAVMENWMKPAGVVLLSAFIVAYFAFVFGTLKANRVTDSLIESGRRDRWELYARIRQPKAWSRENVEKSEYFPLLQKNSIYGVVLSLAAWPIKNQLSNGLSIWTYFFGMIGISSVFFFERRQAMDLFRHALGWRSAVRARLETPERANDEESVIPLFLEIVGPALTPASGSVRRAGRISYQVAINTATEGWLYEMRRFKEIDHLLLVATPGHDSLDEAGWQVVTKMIEATGIEAAVVISMRVDEDCLSRLHKLSRSSRCHLTVFDAADLQDLIETRAQNKDVGIVFARRRVEGRFVPALEY